MRRSTVIRLTLLPLLASATLANAQAAPDDEGIISPPGMAPQVLAPPGLTPLIEPCVADDARPECSHGTTMHGTVRGGFGGYFWSGGG